MCSSWAGKLANPQLINPGKKVGNTHVLGSPDTPRGWQCPCSHSLPVPLCSPALQATPLPWNRTKDAGADPGALSCVPRRPNPLGPPALTPHGKAGAAMSPLQIPLSPASDWMSTPTTAFCSLGLGFFNVGFFIYTYKIL